MKEDEKNRPWDKFVEEENKKRAARPWDLLNKNIGRVETIVAKERLSICQECPRFAKLTNQCKECGCQMNLKTKLPNSFCPLGKWEAVEIRHDMEIE
jgi:hypothetical protein